MSGRSARRARQAAAAPNPPLIEEAWSVAKVAFRPGEVPEGTCWICGDPSHKRLADAFASTAKPNPVIFDRRGVQDAIAHVLMAALGPINERTETHGEAWQQAFAALARAVGLLSGAVEHHARGDEFAKTSEQAAAIAGKEAVSMFFEELIDRWGEGTYEIELLRKRPPVPRKVH